jgi:soluble lytic murein transglycosylase-like protein
MAGVTIPISADFNTGDIDKVLSQLTQEINRLGNTVAGANKVKFNPVDKSTMADLQRVQAQFDSLLKISGDFRKRMKDTGQNGTDFFNIDWAKMYPDQNSRSRQMRKAYDYVTAGTGAGFTAHPAPGFDERIGWDDIAGKREWERRQRAGAGGGGNGDGGNGTPASSWGSAGRRILSSGLRATGGAGGAAAGALEGGMAGIGGPMILANLVAQGVSAVVGAVKAKIGAAQQLDVGYDTLKRQLGDVGVGFRELKTSLENASWSFGATYEETQKVASAFSQAAGTFGKDAKTLANEVAIAGGFARSYGIDPSRAGAFFGQMRQTGVTTDENGSKRLALLIGETVTKSGASAKMDEVLAAIAGFTQQQSRMGMATANVGGYLSEFATLANTGTPGTDAQSIANLLGTVSGSIQRGGNAGEAGKNFMFAALGRRNGLDPIMTTALQEQGMFGTAEGAFGEKSAMARFGRAYGVRMPTMGAGSGQTNFASLMDSLQRQYRNNPELMLSAMSNLFGTSINQSAALAAAQKDNPASIGGSVSRLSRLGLDMSKVNATGIQRLTSIEADKSLSSEEKDRQFRDAYQKNQEKTEGTEVRDGLSGVQKVITDMADKMVPLTTTIMNSVVYMAGGGTKSQRQIADANNKAERNDAVDQINAAADEKRKAARQAKQEFNAKGAELYNKTTDMRLSPAERAAAQKEYDRLKAAADTSGVDADQKAATEYQDERLAAKNKYGSPGTQSLRDQQWLKDYEAQTDKMIGADPGTSMSQLYQESKFDPAATSDAGAMGLAQIMPDTLKSLEKRLGRKLNPYDPHDAVLMQREVMRENKGHFGNIADSLSGYNKGWDKSKWNNSETRAYAPAIMGRASEFAGNPVPSDADTKAAAAEAASGGGNPVQVHVAVDNHHTFSMPGGAAPNVNTVSTTYSAPKPAGARG